MLLKMPLKINLETNKCLRVTDNLTGEIKNATTCLETLMSAANTIKSTATTAAQKALKAYLEAKLDMESTRDTIKLETEALVYEKLECYSAKMEDYSLKVKHQQSDDSSKFNKARYKGKYYADKYKIKKGKVVQSSAKNFQEDTTPIECDSRETLLVTYKLVGHVAAQYGIFITSIQDLEP